MCTLTTTISLYGFTTLTNQKYVIKHLTYNNYNNLENIVPIVTTTTFITNYLAKLQQQHKHKHQNKKYKNINSKIKNINKKILHFDD